MLPVAHRLRSSTDFTDVLRRGTRAGRPTLAVHLLAAPDDLGPARAGLVVSKAVGGSVVRHRVARRMRALLAARLSDLPPGSRLVVRATPAAAQAPSRDLARDLDSALVRVLR